jgi:hypothetical protein
MIQKHFIGCQKIKRFIFFRAPDCQSTEGYLFALVRSFSYVFYIIVENRKTMHALYIFRIMESKLFTKAYKTLDSDAV